MYYFCEKHQYYKSITVQDYLANCVSWVPRLTLLDLRANWTYVLRTELVHGQADLSCLCLWCQHSEMHCLT